MLTNLEKQKYLTWKKREKYCTVEEAKEGGKGYWHLNISIPCTEDHLCFGCIEQGDMDGIHEELLEACIKSEIEEYASGNDYDHMQDIADHAEVDKNDLLEEIIVYMEKELEYRQTMEVKTETKVIGEK